MPQWQSPNASVGKRSCLIACIVANFHWYSISLAFVSKKKSQIKLLHTPSVWREEKEFKFRKSVKKFVWRNTARLCWAFFSLLERRRHCVCLHFSISFHFSSIFSAAQSFFHDFKIFCASQIFFTLLLLYSSASILHSSTNLKYLASLVLFFSCCTWNEVLWVSSAALRVAIDCLIFPFNSLPLFKE